jgi:hypothetical protein
MSARDFFEVAEAAGERVRQRPGLRTEELARDVGAHVDVVSWALYRAARHYGLGQDVFGCWWHFDDNAEIRERYNDVGGAPCLRAEYPEPH